MKTRPSYQPIRAKPRGTSTNGVDHFAYLGAGPEPAVDDGGLEVRPLTAVKVTFPPGGPEISDGSLGITILEENRTEIEDDCSQSDCAVYGE